MSERSAWDEKKGCQCGAGMPCECQHANGLEEPYERSDPERSPRNTVSAPRMMLVNSQHENPASAAAILNCSFTCNPSLEQPLLQPEIATFNASVST